MRIALNDVARSIALRKALSPYNSVGIEAVTDGVIGRVPSFLRTDSGARREDALLPHEEQRGDDVQPLGVDVDTLGLKLLERPRPLRGRDFPVFGALGYL